ncbi:hypothetical protein D9758_006865 [Tetrapyrgos nigripes]|uniref:Tyrosinase copper-binding domain-containing protein n=1 Tax=Tetrapyrgos nigripes TaxID=182062 RepID=A0A8H5CW67_9AGAR|nr:hypothetical protein D9758_006865 [Tetrapyrgos nigripes]
MLVPVLAIAVSSLLAVTFVQAECTNPSVRKEWRTLSAAERTEWIEAVKCLGKLPNSGTFQQTVFPDDIAAYNSSGSWYDDFVYMHMDLNHRIHVTGFFLPWHRWYVQVYENTLKEKCGYTGVSPYWDWASDSADVKGSSIFDADVEISGLGGWGNLSNDAEVYDGGFSDFKLTYPVPHQLRRNFTLQPYIGLDETFFTEPYLYANESFTQSVVDHMVNNYVGDYKGFQQYMEGWEGPHGSVHLTLGGDLGGTCPDFAPSTCVGGPTFSANEPIFWFHHAMVDKVWYDWQNADPANAGIFFGGSVQMQDNITIWEQYPNGGPPYLNLSSLMPSNGLFDQPTIQDVINTTSGMLCYVYE